MASSRIYLSGAAKRKQRQIRYQNEAKSRRTLEDLNWCTKIQRNNKSQSEGVEISSDQVVCEDDTRDMDNDNTTHTTTDLDERVASQETGVTIGETISFQVRSSDAERIISPSLSNDPSSWKNLTEQDKEYIVKIGPPKNPFPKRQLWPQLSSKHFFSGNDKWRKSNKRLVGMEHIKTKSVLLPMLSVSRNITKRGDIQNI